VAEVIATVIGLCEGRVEAEAVARDLVQVGLSVADAEAIVAAVAPAALASARPWPVGPATKLLRIAPAVAMLAATEAALNVEMNRPPAVGVPLYCVMMSFWRTMFVVDPAGFHTANWVLDAAVAATMLPAATVVVPCDKNAVNNRCLVAASAKWPAPSDTTSAPVRLALAGLTAPSVATTGPTRVSASIGREPL
jgi:hypothetical protein